MPVKKPMPATTTTLSVSLSLRCSAVPLRTYSADMVPAKRRFVNLGESEPSSLVGVGNVSIVVVKVVERGVPA